MQLLGQGCKSLAASEFITAAIRKSTNLNAYLRLVREFAISGLVPVNEKRATINIKVKYISLCYT